MEFILKIINIFIKYKLIYFFIRNNILKLLCKILVIIIIFYNNNLFALGLSDIKVNSYLNEPLSATIEIIGAEELEPISLLVNLADPKDFIRAGIPKSPLLSYLKFEIKNINGGLIVYIYSNIVIKESSINFLLQFTWPDGTMIKSYTILLDPKTISSKAIDTDANKQSIIRQKNGLPNKIKKNIVNNMDGIFFTGSLEHPNENELLVNNNLLDKEHDLNKFKNNKSKNHENFIKSVHLESNSSNPESLNYSNDINTEHNSSNDNKEHNLTVLNKLINNLQNLPKNLPKNNKLNYQKLLDLNPKAISLNKEGEKLAENFAIAQINSELNELRREKTKQNNIKVAANVINNNGTNNSYLPLEQQMGDTNNYANSQLGQQSSNTNNYANPQQHAVYYNSNMAKFPYYSNNLLLTFFLVTATMYLFYKLIVTAQSTAIDTEVTEVIDSDFKKSCNVGLKSNNKIDLPIANNTMDQSIAQPITNNTMDQSIAQPEKLLSEPFHKFGSDAGSDVFDNINNNVNHQKDFASNTDLKHNKTNENNYHNIINNPTSFIRNEELELKMALASQYIDAGDKNSAKELLQEIINIKDQKYKDQINSILNTLN